MKKKYIIPAALVLVAVCFVVILAFGRTYTEIIPLSDGPHSAEEYIVEIDNDVIRVAEKDLKTIHCILHLLRSDAVKLL